MDRHPPQAATERRPYWSAVLRALREARAVTQAGFAGQLGVGTRTVQRWERGAAVPDAVGEAALLAYCEANGLYRRYADGPLSGEMLTPSRLRDLLGEARLAPPAAARPPMSDGPAGATAVDTETQAGSSRAATTANPAAVAAARATEAMMTANTSLYRRAFVARESELHQLHAAFDEAISGQGGLVMVAGEPGIGKTALCRQLTSYVSVRGGEVLAGHCYEDGAFSIPYLPFVEAMRSYVLSREPAQLEQELGAGAGEVARLVPEIATRLKIEVSAGAGDPAEDRYRLLQAVTEFLAHVSAVQPLLLVLEDLHGADRGTLDLLVHLARNLSGTRLLVIGTYRDIEVDRTHPLSPVLADLQRRERYLRLPLRGLTPEEVQRMLAAVSQQEVARPFAELVQEQTEGNPLFVQEMLRYLVEAGLVERREGMLQQAAGDSLAERIPEGLRDVIGRRLARLTGRTNQALAVASVIGREFRSDVLQRVSGLSPEELDGSLEEARGAAVVEERSMVSGAVSYRFTHAFFRQTLSEELIGPRRIRLHQQAAHVLEAVYGRRAEEHAAELAEHFSQSTDENDLRKAVHYGRRAAGRAVSVYSYAEAARHLDQALVVQEVFDHDDEAMRCDLLLELGDALVSLGETDRAAHQLAPDALRLAESLGDRRRCSAVCRLMERVYGSMMAAIDLDLGEHWAELADKYADDGTVDRVHADAFRGWMTMTAGRAVAGLALLRRANKLAWQLNDTSLLVTTAWALLNGNMSPPEAHEERMEVAEQLSERSLEGIRNTTLAVTLLYLGQVYLTWGRRSEAEHSWRSAAEAANRSREAEMALVPMQIEGLVGTLDGRLESILELGERIRQRGEEVGRARLGVTLGARAIRRALVYLGDSDLALAGIPESPELFLGGGVYSAQRAVCLAYSGQSSEARDLMNRMLTALDVGRPDDPTTTPVLRYLLETAVLLREKSAARILAARLAPLAGLLHTEAEMCYNIGRLCGGAAALLGETEKARGYYQQAIEICTKVRFRPELALTRLELAELLLAHYPGERAQAIEYLDHAITESADMKMQPALERALTLKAAMHNVPAQAAGQRSSAAYPHGLSEREVQVLCLVAAGRSNQEIADELVLSINTVLRHITHIFSKTGTRNRAEATAYAIRLGLLV